MSLCRWLRNLLHPKRGYWICPDDWQGQQLADCEWHDGPAPVIGETVFYRSGGALKPWGRRSSD